MSDIELTENWPVERTKSRIDELNSELDEISKEMSRLDKELNHLSHRRKQVEKRKDFLARKMSNNTRYKNVLVNEVFEKSDTSKQTGV